jgi:hypothetical protein
MKHHRLAIFTAAFGLAVFAAPVAHAFTFEGPPANASGDAAARYTDPEKRLTGSGNGNTIQQGNSTIQFGAGQSGSFGQRYDPSPMFNPIGRPTGER